MDDKQIDGFRFAVGGLHQATDAVVGDAWTELFRLGIKYARIARERAAHQEQFLGEQTPQDISTTEDA